MQLWLLLSVVTGGLYQLGAHLWWLEKSVVSESAAAVAVFSVCPSVCAAGLVVCAAVVENLEAVVIVVFLSLYFLC